MSLLHALILGIIQGITEFLPISSSGHLVLGESLLGLEVNELKDFDVVVHVGTLLAILLYFIKDLIKTKYWGLLIVGTLPAILVGFTLEDQIDNLFRSAQSVGLVMLVVGALFILPEPKQKEDPALKRKAHKLTWPKALAIGIAQSIAIIPGVSRSGSTIFTGRLLGLKREQAARFSFMLGSIAIAGAGLLTALDIESTSVEPTALSVGFLAAFLSGIFAVHWLMRFLKRHSLRVFGVYLIILGLGVTLLMNP